MQADEWLIPYLLLVLAGIAITCAMWFAVRRPSSSRVLGRIAWQASQAGFAAISAILAATCVLGAVARL